MMANEHITIGSSSYEKNENFKLFRLFSDKSKFYSQEVKYGLKVGNLSYCSVYILLYSGLLWKNLKIKIIILPVVLYACKTWSLTLREECRLRVLKTGS